MDSKNIFTITLMILLITKITIGKPFNDCQQSNNNNLQGKCVYLTKCQNLFQLILRGNLSESEKNYLRDSQCGVNNGQPLVCCQQENIQLEIIPQILRRQSESLFPYPGICGTQTTSRIVGGSKTSIGEFPWTALIKYRNRYNHITFHCAGALINSRYVLTAAHCIVGTELAKTWKPVEVRLGEWNLKTDVDCIIDGLDYEDFHYV
uniref:CSON007646 protein n=1 Tax=Culicoides sonorensis TaxID=179676 RepID=A0A336LB45_CULSO